MLQLYALIERKYKYFSILYYESSLFLISLLFSPSIPLCLPPVVSKLLLSPREGVRDATAAYINSHVSSVFEPEAVGSKVLSGQ